MSDNDNETKREFCRDCGDEFDAAIVRMGGKVVFHARVCEPCVMNEEKRTERRERPAGWIPLLDEIPSELADFDFNAMPDKARKRGVEHAWGGRRVIDGETGSGKSYLTVAFAHARAKEGKRSFFTTGRAIKQTLVPTDSPITKERNGKLLDRVRAAKWVCIDDIGHAKWTQPYSDLILDILNQRKGGGKSTIITSQFPASAWVERFRQFNVAGGVDKETLKAIVRRLDDHFEHWTL